MMLVLTLVVRDEEDILDTNLSYHLRQGVDLILVTDHHSQDGTPEILERWEGTGAVRVFREDDDVHDQAARVNRMVDLAVTEYGADWLIHADADEFWWPADGDLRTTLGTVPPEVSTVVAWRYNFVPRPPHPSATGPTSDPATDSFAARMRWRMTRSETWDGKPMGRKVCHRAGPDLSIAMGNHSVEGLGGELLDDARIEILHFPWRSQAHLEQKVRNGGAALERNTELDAGMGWHWRELWRRLQADGDLASVWTQMCIDDEILGLAIDHGDVIADDRLVRARRHR